MAFRLPGDGGIGVSLGTLVLVVNAALLWLYSLSCHAGRHLCGGSVRSFSDAPDPLPDLEVPHPAQRPAHAVRLGQPGRSSP